MFWFRFFRRARINDPLSIAVGPAERRTGTSTGEKLQLMVAFATV
jgi:hypothetical protein